MLCGGPSAGRPSPGISPGRHHRRCDRSAQHFRRGTAGGRLMPQHIERAFETAIEETPRARLAQGGPEAVRPGPRSRPRSQPSASSRRASPRPGPNWPASTARAWRRRSSSGSPTRSTPRARSTAAPRLQVLRQAARASRSSSRAHGLNPDLEAKYELNRLVVTRQVNFDPTSEKSRRHAAVAERPAGRHGRAEEPAHRPERRARHRAVQERPRSEAARSSSSSGARSSTSPSTPTWST